MKKFVFPILVLTLIANITFAQSWRATVDAPIAQNSSVHFVNDMIGWTVGSTGQVLKTTDAGANWEVVDISTDVSLYAVYFVDNNIGFIGGDDNMLFKTTDGGANWTSQVVAGSDGDIKDIDFLDASNGWIMPTQNSSGQIMKTTDGGSTWVVSHTATTKLYAMDFNGSNGICVSKKTNQLLYTTDGITWNVSATPSMGGHMYTRTDIRSVKMFDQNNAVATGWGSRAAGLQPTIILKTSDGGANWTFIDIPEESRLYINMYNVYSQNAQVGLIAGGTTYDGAEVIKTTDAGNTWARMQVPFGFTIKDISGTGSKIWAVGSYGNIIYSPNFGTTWEYQAKVPGSTFKTINFVDNSVIVAGSNGAYFKSVDKGQTWETKFIDADYLCPQINDISFVDNNIGYMARDYRMVCKTTDAGDNWSVVLSDTFATKMKCNGVDFIDANNGVVVGDVAMGAAMITTDGGANWTTVGSSITTDMLKVHMKSATEIVAVGEDLNIQYTTDGGSNWSAATINNLPSGLETEDVYSVDFFDNNFALASGKFLIKTNDGGVTWENVTVPGLDTKAYSVHAIDLQTWYLAAGKVVKVTTDAGATWNDVSIDVLDGTKTLYKVTSDANGNLWTGGYSNTLVTNASLTAVDDDSNITPDKFALNQNYPNPFNPSTTVEYSLTKSSYVSIRVYDMLGREMISLVNQVKTAGNHKVVVNGSNLSSGVYLYSLSVDGQTITKKMTLLK